MLNKTCPLILRDLYSYDIVSAFPTIMGRQFYDFKGISLDNKKERNIFIGKQQIGNPQLTSYLNQSIKSLTEYYLRVNEIKPEETIFTQKDGFILTRQLSNNSDYIEMKFRGMIDLMIIDISRTSMVYFNQDGEVVVKGVKYYYKALDKIYQKFIDIDFYDKKTVFKQLNYLRNKILKPSDISLYGVEKDDRYVFMLKNDKSLKVKDFDYVDPKEIDTRKYFNFYFKPFFDSIFLEVMR